MVRFHLESLMVHRLHVFPTVWERQVPQGLNFSLCSGHNYSALLGSSKVRESRKQDLRGPLPLYPADPHRAVHSERPVGPQGAEDRPAAAQVRRSPATPHAGGRRMRGAGRGVVNGAFCLPEFGAGGRARRRRRRGGADGGGAGGPARWEARGSGGGGGWGRRVLGPRGR